MFLRQFGASIGFLIYCIWLEPRLSVHVWKLMAAVILIKCWAEPPIPLPIHLGECVGMAALGIWATLYFQQLL